MERVIACLQPTERQIWESCLLLPKIRQGALWTWKTTDVQAILVRDLHIRYFKKTLQRWGKKYLHQQVHSFFVEDRVYCQGVLLYLLLHQPTH
jgi:hypothetical protein